MSYLALHADADKAFLGKFWGGKVRDENGALRDTGVQEFVEELVRVLTSQGPIKLERPLEFINKTNGPAIKIYNDGPQVDWMGVRVEDRAGNQAQLGIGLGNEGINANSFIPDPRYAITPEDQHRFHSDLGDNAAGDREHRKAVEAGNGLVAPLGLVGNFQVPVWLVNLVKQPQYQADDCHPRYRVDWFGQPVYWPTYVPQKMILIGQVQGDIARGESGTVNEVEGDAGAETEINPAVSYTVFNRQFGCVEAGDIVTFTCVGSGYEILTAPEKLFFSLGITASGINKGAHGYVNLTGHEGSVYAFNPFSDVQGSSVVGVIRDTSQECGEWVIIAAECEPEPEVYVTQYPTGTSEEIASSGDFVDQGDSFMGTFTETNP